MTKPTYYRPQTKFAKVMFLQVSVCPHGGKACMVLLGGHAWFYLGGMCSFIWGGVWFYLGGMHGFIWGACVVLGACMVLFGGACVVFPGGCAWFFQGGMHVFFSFSDTMRYGQ